MIVTVSLTDTPPEVTVQRQVAVRGTPDWQTAENVGEAEVVLLMEMPESPLARDQE
ncbi:hypothetical protein KB893_011225 [Coralloluteibacterium stylophorae]|uniref:Uncharacterized protein n=1 Tax=Coralloluteibacterium stylophorae TaxID=1776034 RepID=A0A8J7VQY8_9GAMM|nr:hypothetical protein [Coralloluteibacterium stylophorae]MBS7457700.1 hypothetical protein [Coralloluteibacterium stylophorae]